MHSEGFCCSTEHKDKMIFPHLDLLLYYISLMVIRWYKLIGYSWFSNCVLVFPRCLIVEHFMFGGNSTHFHAFKCLCASKNSFYLYYIRYWLHPYGFAVNIMDDHMVFLTRLELCGNLAFRSVYIAFSYHMTISVCRAFSNVCCCFLLYYCLGWL